MKLVAFVSISIIILISTTGVGTAVSTSKPWDGPKRFSVATAKSLKMKKIIESTQGQHVVSVEDVSISQANTEMNSLVRSWNQRYGAA